MPFLFIKQLEYIQQNDYIFVQAVIDKTDHYALEIFKCAHFSNIPVWNTYLEIDHLP